MEDGDDDPVIVDLVLAPVEADLDAVDVAPADGERTGRAGRVGEHVDGREDLLNAVGVLGGVSLGGG